MRDSFVFYKSYYEAIELLPKSQRADAYRAIFEFMFNGNDITDELKDVAKAIFLMAKPTLEASVKKYEAGKKGAEAKKATLQANDKQPTKQPQSTLASKEEAPLQANDKQPTKQNASNVNVNVNVNENVNANKEPPSIVSPLGGDASLASSKPASKQKASLPKSQSELVAQAVADQEVAALVDEEFLHRLAKYRRSIKHPFKTLKGIKGVLRDFVAASQATGKSFEELFEVMSLREWRTVRPEYFSQSSSKIKPTSVVEANKLAVQRAIEMRKEMGNV